MIKILYLLNLTGIVGAISLSRKCHCESIEEYRQNGTDTQGYKEFNQEYKNQNRSLKVHHECQRNHKNKKKNNKKSRRNNKKKKHTKFKHKKNKKGRGIIRKIKPQKRARLRIKRS